LAQSTRWLAQSILRLAQSTQGLIRSTRRLAQSILRLAQSTQGLIRSTRGLAQSILRLAQSTQGLIRSTRGLAQSILRLAQSTQGLIRPTRWLTEPTQRKNLIFRGLTASHGRRARSQVVPTLGGGRAHGPLAQRRDVVLRHSLSGMLGNPTAPGAMW
jgi:phage-related protein